MWMTAGREAGNPVFVKSRKGLAFCDPVNYSDAKYFDGDIKKHLCRVLHAVPCNVSPEPPKPYHAMLKS